VITARVGNELFEALLAAAGRAVTEAGGRVAAANVLSACLSRAAGPNPAEPPSAVPWPRVEWRPADLAGVPAGAVAAEAVASMRECGWRAGGDLEWDATVLAGLRTAVSAAGRDGRATTGARDLAMALLDDRDVRTQEALAGYRTDRASMVRRLRESGPGSDVSPWAPAIAELTRLGAVGRFRYAQPVTAFLRRRIGRPDRLPAVLHAVAAEADRHAVRLRHRIVEPIHLIVAVLSVHDQILATGAELPGSLSRRAVAARQLHGGLRRGQAPEWLAVDLVVTGAVGDVGPGAAPREPDWSPSARAALRRAGESGSLLRPAGFDDVLAAVVVLDDPAVPRLLSRCGIESGQLLITTS
jgi:hypothetical protein